MQELADRLEAVLGQIAALSGMRRIADQVLGATATTIDFSNIPQTYAHLKLILAVRGQATQDLSLRFNNDTGANYHTQEVRGSGTATPVSDVAVGRTAGRVGWLTGTGTRLNSVEVMIPNYADSANWQTFHATWGEFHDVVAGQEIFFGLNASEWQVAAAVNRITIMTPSSALFQIGSRATLYGLT